MSESPVGLYTVTLDEKGAQIESSISHKNKNQMFAKSWENLHFQKDRWMVLFAS